jgi:cyclic pyranopterin phosphate synthase
VLIDTHGRVATDLRVSLTDRCNLRCTYCMPEEGLAWLAKPDVLTDDEIVRLVTVAVTRLGVKDVRFTVRRPRCATRAWTGSTSRWTPCAPTSTAPSPAATGTPTSSPASPRPPPRA